MKTIVCVGCGTVGYATCLALSSLDHSIIGIDVSVKARNRMKISGFPSFSPTEVMMESKLDDVPIDAILLALPTPYCSVTHTLSDTYLVSSIPTISFFVKKNPTDRSLFIIIHSTVSVGTSQKFAHVLKNAMKDNDCSYHVVYHPEFLRAKTSLDDASHPRKQIFAYVDGHPKVDLSFYTLALQEIFSPSESCRSPVTILDTAEEAEFLKLVHNFSNAMRISFSNCCAQLASSLSVKHNKSIDASRVLSIISETAESFHNNKYGICPGYPYSGACLPKDVQCFMNITEEQPYRQFLESIYLINEKEKKNQFEKRSNDCE